MAAYKKFGGLQSSCGALRHILREVKNPSNKDIDPARRHLNYSLAPRRQVRPYDYLKHRLREVDSMKRDDVNVLCSWIITKPKDLPELEEEQFFRCCYSFLVGRYGGEKNVVAAEVHKDESGEAHLHYCFVPVTKTKPSDNLIGVVRYFEEHPLETNISKISRETGISRKTIRRYRNKTAVDIHYEKVSADAVVNLTDLQTFHLDLQDYLNRAGLHAKVHTGITKAQGGNKSVAQLKYERDQKLAADHKIDKEFSYTK